MPNNALKKKYEHIEKISYVQYRAPGPNRPIAYPMGIPSTPSPSEAHIIKLAVFCLDNLYPNSRGSARNRANILARNMPFRKLPINAANHAYPLIAAIILTVHPPIMQISKIFSRSEILIVTKSNKIRNTVLVTQNTRLANAA